jgi:hypothetical protein
MAEATHQHDQAPELPADSFSVALIIDGVVQDVLHSEARLAALFLSEPEIVEVTDWYRARTNTSQNLVGAKYENGEFTLPEKIEEQSVVGSSISPKLNPSFVWNNETQNWEPPIPYPVDDKHYRWDEETISWVEITEDLETIIQGMEQA